MTREMCKEMGLYNVDKWYGKRQFFNCVNLSEILGTPNFGIWVLSSDDMKYGADVLNHPDFIDTVAEKLEDDLFLIPSSIHEILAIRKETVEDPRRLSAMIRTINIDEVASDLWLGKDPLLYKRGSFEISKAIMN